MTCCNGTNRCTACKEGCCSQCEAVCYECERTFCDDCLFSSFIEGMPVVLCPDCWLKEEAV